MRVFLCEKPSQAKDIAPHVGARTRGEGFIAGPDVVVTWCIGHLLEQAQPQVYGAQYERWSLADLPILPSPWLLEVKSAVRSQFKVVQAQLQRASEVVIATDADREGEVIAREVLERVGYRGRISRLWLSAMDSASVRKALGALRAEQDTRSLYQSGLGRSRADWLAGMNLTRALTTAFGAGGPGSVLHCGRVQTPVLALIVRRERAIAQFRPKTYYVLQAQFLILGVTVPMDWVAPAALLDAQGHCVDAQQVQALAGKVARRAGRVSAVNRQNGREAAPLPYYLGALQKEANQRFGLKAQQVLEICQSLYEKHKAITYPRTDCEYLPVSMWGDVPQVLQALVHVDASLKSLVERVRLEQPTRCFNDSKITAHHAIIPTLNASVQMAAMSPHERTVYDLVRRRFIAQFLGEHLYIKTTIEVLCEGERFVQTGRVTTAPGWRQALSGADSGTQGQSASAQAQGPAHTSAQTPTLLLPACEVGEQALNVQAQCVQRQTEPPKRYTEASLIAAMESIDKEIEDPRFKAVMKNKEKAGIGTDATRSAIIEGLFKREYIANQQKAIVPTGRGTQLIELLEQLTPELVDPVLTAHWEEQLSQVESGALPLSQFESAIGRWVSQLIEAIRARSGSVQVAASAQAVSAAARSAAANRKKPTPTQGGASANLAGQVCPSCGRGRLELRNLRDSDKQFWGCSEFRKGCKHFAWAQPGVRS